MARVLGLDGCPGGWAGALVDGPRITTVRFDGVRDGFLEALSLDVDLVAVDIPIGLPRPGDTRACDRATREVLGRRRSSVFPAPPRELFGLGAHAEASAASKALCGKGISIQAFNIYDRIAAVDEAMTPALQHRVLEVHPEVGFLSYAGDLGSKRTRDGRDRRETALRRTWPDLDVRVRGAKRDDVLDAAICAWVGVRWLRGEARLLPPEPPRDDCGLLMAIAG